MQLTHFSPGLLLPNGSSHTKHWPVSHSVSFCRLAGFTSLFGTSVLAILRLVVLSTFVASASRAFFTEVSVRIIERPRFLPRWFVLRGVAFVNGRTSPGVRCSSRQDDLPRIGASLGRLTHVSTSPVKNASTSPDPDCSHLQTAAHCTIAVADIPLVWLVLMYISFGIVHCKHLVHKLTTLYTAEYISTFFLLGGHKKQQTGITRLRDYFSTVVRNHTVDQWNEPLCDWFNSILLNQKKNQPAPFVNQPRSPLYTSLALVWCRRPG